MKILNYLSRLWWLVSSPLTKDREAKQSVRFLRDIAPVLISKKRPRILFERHAGLGDVVCTFPAVLALREKYPEAAIVFSVQAAFAPAVDFARVADVVAPLRYGLWTSPGWLDQFFDQVYRPLTDDEEKIGADHIHLVDNFSAKTGVQPRSRQPRMSIPSEFEVKMRERFQAHQLEDKIVVAVNTGPSWAVREWTAEGWEKLAKWLNGRGNVRVIQLGADVHSEMGSIKAVRLPGALDWIGQISLEETIACIAASDLFIGIDSGLLHIAGAVGTPTVSIFGPTSADLRIPTETPAVAVAGDVDCLGCHHREPVLHWRSGCPHDIACMKTLSARQVIAACEQMLDSVCAVGATRL